MVEVSVWMKSASGIKNGSSKTENNELVSVSSRPLREWKEADRV
jgi:hypothetical protein